MPEPATTPTTPETSETAVNFTADTDTDTEIELDEEIDAILTAVTALDTLLPQAQRRVITYLADRYLFTPVHPDHPDSPEPPEPHRRLHAAPNGNHG